MRSADYVIKRFVFALFTIFMAITINFFLFRIIPGSAVTDLARVPNATPQLRHALTVEFGLNQSKWHQYVTYLWQLLHANMGISFANQQPVFPQLMNDLKNTIPMVTIGTVAAIIIGVFFGIISAWRRNSVIDHASTSLAIAFYSFPPQFLGLVLLILFAGTLPSSGMMNPLAGIFGQVGFWSRLQDIGVHMILPALTLCLTLYGQFTLIMRSSMLETLGEDYVLTARARDSRTEKSSYVMRCVTRSSQL